MTRNQKIALGCGGAGCLGLIVVVIAGALIYLAYRRPSYSTNRTYNSNITTIRNSNGNDNSATNDNSSSTSTAASMSDDDKHKLYQAATMTYDAELLQRVNVKIGLLDDDYTPGENYQKFIVDHVTWSIRNTDFIQSLDSPEKARAYVDQNFPD